MNWGFVFTILLKPELTLQQCTSVIHTIKWLTATDICYENFDVCLEKVSHDRISLINTW